MKIQALFVAVCIVSIAYMPLTLASKSDLKSLEDLIADKPTIEDLQSGMKILNNLIDKMPSGLPKSSARLQYEYAQVDLDSADKAKKLDGAKKKIETVAEEMGQAIEFVKKGSGTKEAPESGVETETDKKVEPTKTGKHGKESGTEEEKQSRPAIIITIAE
jgi:hypothetical protein